VKLKAFVAVAACVASWSCDVPTDPDRDVAYSVVIIGGDNQTLPLKGISQAIEIEVQDIRGRPVRHNPLYWTIQHKDHVALGTIVEAVAETDRHGRADGRVQVDTLPGEYLVNILAGRYITEQGDSIRVEATAKVFAN